MTPKRTKKKKKNKNLDCKCWVGGIENRRNERGGDKQKEVKVREFHLSPSCCLVEKRGKVKSGQCSKDYKLQLHHISKII